MKDKISIIVPVYQTEAYLEKCVRSLLAQTYTDFELILVEDGSPDGSGALCDALAGEDARIRVIHQENGGVSCARNAGLQAAAGSFVCFADSDDWIEPTYLETMYARREETGAAISGCGFAEHRGEQVSFPCEEVNSGAAVPSRSFLQDALDGHLGVRLSVWGWLIPAILAKSVCFDPELPYGEDALWLCGVLKEAVNVCFTAAPLYHYVADRSGNTATRRSLERSRLILTAWQRMAALYAEEGGALPASFNRILTDISLQSASQAAAEGNNAVKEELLRLARGYYKKIAGSAYISRKDKLRLRLLLTAPVAGPKLWQKLKGGRT